MKDSFDDEICRLPKSMMHPPMSKNAYRAHILGMCTKFIRSVLFNILMLFVGITAGMSFTIMHVQKAWKEKCEHDAAYLFEKQLKKYGIGDEDIINLLIYMQNKHMKPIAPKSNSPKQKNKKSSK